jgi:hypothetical protein
MASKKIVQASGTFRGDAASGGAPSFTQSPLLTERQTAERLNWSMQALQRRRGAGLPPAWLKLGRSVRYSAEVIERFIADGIRMPTGGGGS